MFPINSIQFGASEECGHLSFVGNLRWVITKMISEWMRQTPDHNSEEARLKVLNKIRREMWETCYAELRPMICDLAETAVNGIYCRADFNQAIVEIRAKQQAVLDVLQLPPMPEILVGKSVFFGSLDDLESGIVTGETPDGTIYVQTSGDATKPRVEMHKSKIVLDK